MIQEILLFTFLYYISYKIYCIYNSHILETNISLCKQVAELTKARESQNENIKELLLLLSETADISETILQENAKLIAKRQCLFKKEASNYTNRKCKICRKRIRVSLRGCEHISHNPCIMMNKAK
eukprot:NODE_130_length_16779_cov_1.687410.p15 type:complete len:125 gc:universal NODE_130_length_16779_cov_1.687410:1274-1648(+)